MQNTTTSILPNRCGFILFDTRLPAMAIHRSRRVYTKDEAIAMADATLKARRRKSAHPDLLAVRIIAPSN